MALFALCLSRVIPRGPGGQVACRPPKRRWTATELLQAVTASITELRERYYGCKPASARSQLMGDDLLACVMGGIYTEVEQTLIELQRGAIVQENRSAFQNAMQGRFIEEVQRLSGRRVLAFVSNQHVGPDAEVELFVLAPA